MHAIEREVRILRMYCLLTVPVLILLAFAGFAQRPQFREIDVQRINVVEPNGTTRMVISNKTRAPDAVLGGKTFKRQGGNSAGLIFYNEEGDEDGGLVFSGAARNGRYDAGGALLFDQYHQDQVVGIQYSDDNGSRSAGLQVWDRSDIPAAETLEREQAIARMPDGHILGICREGRLLTYHHDLQHETDQVNLYEVALDAVAATAGRIPTITVSAPMSFAILPVLASILAT